MINQRNIGYLLIGISIVLILLLAFVKVDVDKKDVLLCDMVANNPNLEMQDCPAHTSNTSWFILISFGIAFIILASGIYSIFLWHRKKPVIQKFEEVDQSSMDEDEKTVYSILKESKGSIYQSDLIKKIGFSKVRTTRILDKMESKKIIERKRRGMTNIVILQ
ncbi:MAG: hypothetical protein Q8Q42_02710 [Nanoarchaeota archaeon]|nr:hypothetical protein [Nanoarchaeota archaeon]